MRIIDRFYGLLALLLVGSASLQAQSGDPFGDVDTHKYQGTMTITAQVQQNGEVITDAVVAVYQENELRGKKSVGDGTHPELAFLTVYGDYTGSPQYLHFKVYTNGMTFTCNPNPSVAYEFYGSLGTTSSPYVITLPVSLADDADNSSVLTTYDGQTRDVVLTNRTLWKDGDWNTLCLPFNTDKTGPLADAIIKELDVVDKFKMDNGQWTMDNEAGTNQTGFDPADGTLYLFFKDAERIEAGKPYIVMWTKPEGYDENPADYNVSSPVFTNVTISSTTATSVIANNSGLNSVEFRGSYSPVALTVNDKSNLFVGTGNTLYWPDAANNTDGKYYVHSCQAYFPVDLTGAPDGVRAFRLNLGDEATGIASPKSSPEGKDFTSPLLQGGTGEAWYDLIGRKVNSQLVPGVYIVNGRKVVIK